MSSSNRFAGYGWFYIGTALLAFIVGALIGVSSSPVVGVTMPFLFALLSAGGALYVILGKDEPSQPQTDVAGAPSRTAAQHHSPRDSRHRAAFMGLQLTAFVVGVLPGVWCGVWAKFHPQALWGQAEKPAPAFIGLDFTDARDLAVNMVLDERLILEQVPLTDRQKILATLHNAIAQQRMAEKEGRGYTDFEEAADAVLKAFAQSRSVDQEARPAVRK